jgi:hypothetical protein
MSKRMNIVAGTLVIAALLIAPVGALAKNALVAEGNLTGMVFHDTNGNGALDEGELGIAGVAIAVSGPSDFTDDTTTGEDGTYGFTISEAGDYTVTETDPEGYFSTTPNEVTVTFDGSTPIEDVDFGDATGGFVGGTVYDDVNRSRTFDEGDSPLAGAEVSLFNGTVQVGATVTTGADGLFEFTDVPLDTYTVRETDPPDYYSTTPNEVSVELTAPAPAATVNFGDFMPEEGEISEKESQIWDYFGVPMLDILEMRDTYGWGFGNVARALFLSQLTDTPLADIIAAREDEGKGWGNIVKEFNDGFASLKGNNLGLIMSGRGEPNGAQASKAEACGQELEQYAGFVAQYGQGNVNKACKLYAEEGGQIELGAILSLMDQGLNMKQIKQQIQGPVYSGEGPTTEETDEGHGPPACKGYHKNDPGCE